jgi:CubicO group peptidase (beta-lactamase class C family)
MTIRDLLTHRSGMGLGEGDLLFWPHSTYTRDEIIYKLRFMKPASSFRSHYAYDNLLYMTAGQIIPAVTGISWDDYIRQRIFAPLGMTHSNVTNAGIKPGDNVAFPHSRLDGRPRIINFQVLDNVGPAGALNSCAMDMAKWLRLQLNRGKFLDQEGRLFTEQRSKEMWSPQTILPTDDPPEPLAALKSNFADYGFGWFLRDYRGHKVVGHGGGVAGAGAEPWHCRPDQRRRRWRTWVDRLSRGGPLPRTPKNRLDCGLENRGGYRRKGCRRNHEEGGSDPRLRLQTILASR